MSEDPSSIVRFPVTVSEDLSQRAQSVLRAECGAKIQSIALERLPDHNEARLWVTVAAVAYGVAIHALISSLPAAEFGAVRALQWEPQSTPHQQAA